MFVTLLGIVTEVRPVQPWKVVELIKVTLLGMVIEVRLEQLPKASNPILVTLLGIGETAATIESLVIYALHAISYRD